MDIHFKRRAVVRHEEEHGPHPPRIIDYGTPLAACSAHEKRAAMLRPITLHHRVDANISHTFCIDM